MEEYGYFLLQFGHAFTPLMLILNDAVRMDSSGLNRSPGSVSRFMFFLVEIHVPE